jgi:hypothetical protein
MGLFKKSYLLRCPVEVAPQRTTRTPASHFDKVALNLTLFRQPITWLSIFIFSLGCSGLHTPSLSPQAQQGKAIYMSNCIACHHSDPSQDGNIGPAVSDSSLELLQLRVVEGKYPKGYLPKRKTLLMVPLPQLTPENIQALHEYLNSEQ